MEVKNPSESQAVLSGRLGGSSTSKAKREAARRNGALGGRPRKYEKQTPPTFSYPGGKAKMAKMLVSMMPTEGRRYVEPFAGRGNVFWTAAGELDFQEWHLNDIRTVPWFNAILDHGHELKVPRCTRMEYFKRWSDYKNGCPYANMLAPFMTFSGAGYGAGGFRSNRKGGSTASGYQQSVRMAQHIMRATEPTLTSVDYRQTLDGLGPDSFVYLDPPYLDADVTAYKPSDIDHREMVDLLLQAKFRWMLSEYDNPIYREAFGAPVLKQAAETRHGKPRFECVWASVS
jgi:site-specific DNA-adenine methylase